MSPWLELEVDEGGSAKTSEQQHRLEQQHHGDRLPPYRLGVLRLEAQDTVLLHRLDGKHEGRQQYRRPHDGQGGGITGREKNRILYARPRDSGIDGNSLENAARLRQALRTEE